MLYGSHGSTLYYVSTTSLFSNNTSKLRSHGLFIVVGCFKMIRYHKLLVLYLKPVGRRRESAQVLYASGYFCKEFETYAVRVA